MKKPVRKTLSLITAVTLGLTSIGSGIAFGSDNASSDAYVQQEVSIVEEEPSLSEDTQGTEEHEEVEAPEEPEKASVKTDADENVEEPITVEESGPGTGEDIVVQSTVPESQDDFTADDGNTDIQADVLTWKEDNLALEVRRADGEAFPSGTELSVLTLAGMADGDTDAMEAYRDAFLEEASLALGKEYAGEGGVYDAEDYEDAFLNLLPFFVDLSGWDGKAAYTVTIQDQDLVDELSVGGGYCPCVWL
jgi:hypothetical protein